MEEVGVAMTVLEEIETGAMTAVTTVAMTAEMIAATAAVHVHQAAATGHGTATQTATDETATMIGTGVDGLRHVGQARHVRPQHRPQTGVTAEVPHGRKRLTPRSRSRRSLLSALLS
jgi:hypothetical protein